MKVRIVRKLGYLLLGMIWLHCAPAAADDIILYAYHLKPPYLVDRDRQAGLYYDLARYLSVHVPGHTFKTVYLPRKRLETELESGRLHGLVVGVHPSWFRDAARTRYLWSPPFMHDEDVVVSRAADPVPYDGPESLAGKQLGLSYGYYYYGVDELVKSGRIVRDDAVSEEATLDKLYRKRVDAAIITRRTLDYMVRQRADWQQQFYVARKPHDAFERMILIPREFAAAAPGIASALEAIAQDPGWQKALRCY
jgi:polar amino acid transport system substrate-binding protein